MNIFKGILTLVALILCMGATGYIETHYTMQCIVCETKENDIAIIKDPKGETWVIYDNNIIVGEKLKVTFHTNYTDNTRYDDAIVEYKEVK